MKINYLIKYVALLFVCCAMLGCGKEDPLNPTGQKNSIYGTVTDYATGELVSNANVRLNPIGETTLTGSDGMFQFTDLPDGRYSLSLSKNGYADLDDDYVIEIKNGKSVRRDVQLIIGFESFRVLLDGVEVETLDFGIVDSWKNMEILVTNNGTIPIDLKFRTSDAWAEIEVIDEHGYTQYYSSDYEYNLYPGKGVSKTIRLDLRYYYYYYQSYTGYLYINSAALSKTILIKGIPIHND